MNALHKRNTDYTSVLDRLKTSKAEAGAARDEAAALKLQCKQLQAQVQDQAAGLERQRKQLQAQLHAQQVRASCWCVAQACM